MKAQSLNLDILLKQYRNQSKAEKGFEIIAELLEDNDLSKLDKLLRNHHVESVSDSNEIEARENINELLDFYSLLQVALFSDYISAPLSPKITDEIDFILNSKPLQKYYTENYPSVLPQLILKQIKVDEYFKNNINIQGKVIFDRFLILNQFSKRDDDIQLLLWMYNSGSIGRYTVEDFHQLLESKHNFKVDNNQNSITLNKILWGLTKFTHFINDYAQLLRDCQFNPILQSAIWHYHSNWFNSQKSKIGYNLNITLQIIKKSFSQFNSKDLIYNPRSYLSTIEEIKDWKTNANHLESIETDIEYLFNSDLAQPLHNLNNSLNSN